VLTAGASLLHLSPPGVAEVYAVVDIHAWVLQCCGSGMFIPGSGMFILDPGSRFLPIPDPGSRIPDPGSKNSNKREGRKKFVVITFYVATNFTKLHIIFSFEVLKKKIWTNFQRIIELFPKKLSLSSQKYGFGIRNPGGQKSTGYRIPDPDPQHWLLLLASLLPNATKTF
jgi:hypothetical protein